MCKDAPTDNLEPLSTGPAGSAPPIPRNAIPVNVCPDTADTRDSTGKYYVHDHPLETINYMEYLAEEWTKNKISPKIICSLLQVAKYLSPRLGRKGGMEDLEKDLFKIENYAHRARTGVWIDKK